MRSRVGIEQENVNFLKRVPWKVVAKEENSLEKSWGNWKKSLEKVAIWKITIFEKDSEEEKMLKKEYLLRGKDIRNSSY